MNPAGYETSDLLNELDIDHGFGTRSADPAAPGDVFGAKQVHGTEVLRGPRIPKGAQADAMFTQEPGVAVGIVTADCVPVLFVDRDAHVVAAAHAGWRGSADGIAAIVTRRLEREAGVSAVNLFVAIGPHIGACCYEVDEPVRKRISQASVFQAVRSGHYMLDLLALNIAQLVGAGIPEAQIEHVGACTHCHPERYPSYRRDGTGGRMLHYVRMPHAKG